MIILHKVLIFLALQSTNFAFAMQQGTPSADPRAEEVVVKGELFIIANSLRYECGTCDKPFPDAQAHWHLPLQPNDPLVHVLVRSEVSEDWDLKGHPILRNYFPRHLPLSMLDDKKEGDMLQIPLNEKEVQHWLRWAGIKKLTIELTCKQAYRHGQDTFEDVLNRLKINFAQKPNYLMNCEDNLIKAGILRRLNNNTVVQGPKGFLKPEEYAQLEKTFTTSKEDPNKNYLKILYAVHERPKKYDAPGICSIN